MVPQPASSSRCPWTCPATHLLEEICIFLSKWVSACLPPWIVPAWTVSAQALGEGLEVRWGWKGGLQEHPMWAGSQTQTHTSLYIEDTHTHTQVRHQIRLGTHVLKEVDNYSSKWGPGNALADLA